MERPIQTGKKSLLSFVLSRCVKVAAIFLDFPMFVRVVLTLNSPETNVLTRRDPRVIYKYLGGYLARSFSRGDRARILINHYAYLENCLAAGCLKELANAPLTLWQQHMDGASYRIYLAIPKKIAHTEGDLSLVFQQNDVDIFTLSFTNAPGCIADLAVSNVMYIARVQGKGGRWHLIKEATKRCHDVSPAVLLLAAAEGIAKCLSIKSLIGVSTADQLSIGETSDPSQWGLVYDQFWRSMGGESINHHMFHIPVPLLEKNLSLIKSKHRSRVVRKRQFKHEVTDHVQRVFQQNAMGAGAAE